jgi:four helix bundle suffix protein
MDPESLIPKHGGYRSLKSFQIARLCYDLTVRFCDLYVDRRSRTHDQMVQAARSGVQNIAEGSRASGTSRKTEMKLTNVARASLEELRLDYEDFLRQRGLEQWPPDHSALVRFRAKRCNMVEDVRAWVREERRWAKNGERTLTDTHRQDTNNPDRHRGEVRTGPWPSAQLVANAVLSLLNLCCHLLDRQLEAQAAAFLEEGGFTERLYRLRREKRSGHS